MAKEINVASEQEFIARCFDLDNLSFLIGSGLSKEFDGPTMREVAQALYNNLLKKEKLDEVTVQWIKEDLNGTNLNVEKFLNRLYIKKAYLHESANADSLNDELIDITRKTIFDLCVFTPNKDKLPLLFRFLTSLMTRKSGLARTHLFTVNYDLLVETSSDALGILLNDGFDGSVNRWLNTSQFDLDYYYPSGVVGDKPVRCERVINYFKLHGSLNWKRDDARIIKADCTHANMLIYPSLEKYDMMIYDPFSEIFRRFALAIKRPKGALIIIGYSFADAHINQIILQALEQPMFRLVVVNPQANSVHNNFPESNRFGKRVKLLNVAFKEFVESYLPSEMLQFDKSAIVDEVVNFFHKLVVETQNET